MIKWVLQLWQNIVTNRAGRFSGKPCSPIQTCVNNELLHEAWCLRWHFHPRQSSENTHREPQCVEKQGWTRTSLRSAMVRFMPASCFHTGSAKFRLRGLPVRIAMPSSTPADTAGQSALQTDQKPTVICRCFVHNASHKTKIYIFWTGYAE